MIFDLKVKYFFIFPNNARLKIYNFDKYMMSTCIINVPPPHIN